MFKSKARQVADFFLEDAKGIRIAAVDNSTFEHNFRQQNLNWALPAHDVHNFAAVCNYFREIAIQSFHDNRGIRTGGFQHYATGADDV